MFDPKQIQAMAELRRALQIFATTLKRMKIQMITIK